jgi:large conductance mechanosensitive channel
MFDEFKKFALRGNVFDMAIGVILGTAFGAITKSLVSDILMPPIGLLFGDVDFSNLFITLKPGSTPSPYASLAAAQEAGAVTINYGLFINTLITFILIAWVVFLLIKAINRMQAEPEAETEAPAEPTTKDCHYCYTEIPIKAVRCPHCTSEL